MLERELYARLKNKVQGVMWNRVENAVAPGCFDVNACIQGREFWAELKICKNKNKAPTGTMGLRPSQIIWALGRLQHGPRNIFIFTAWQNALHVKHLTGMEKNCNVSWQGMSVEFGLNDPHLGDNLKSFLINILS